MPSGKIVLTEVQSRDSLTAWAHEVGIIMRDGKITDIFQEDKRSIPRRLFGGDEVRTFKAYTSPFELVFWLRDPDDPSEPDEGVVLDTTILTSDGEPVTGRIWITFSVMADMTDLLLRLLGPKRAIRKVDVANAIKGDLQTKVMAFNLHEYTAADIRGSEDLLRSIHDSLNSDLALAISEYGLQLDNFHVNWGLTIEERERIKQQRHHSSVQDALRAKELRDIGGPSPASEDTRERQATSETDDQSRRDPHYGPGEQTGVASESVGYWVYEDSEDESTDKALIHLGTCRYCDHGKAYVGHLPSSQDFSEVTDQVMQAFSSRDKWYGPFETEDQAMKFAEVAEYPEVRRANCCLPSGVASGVQHTRRRQREPIEVESTARETLRAGTSGLVGYWIYEDEPTDKALVHKGTCGFCNQGQGVRGSRLRDNRWIGPFETEMEAHQQALLTGRSEVRQAKCCLSGDGHTRRRQKETIEVEGTVREALRDATFKVELANGHEVMAYVHGKIRMNYIRVLPGDRVLVQMSPYDLGRGRITYRFR